MRTNNKEVIRIFVGRFSNNWNEVTSHNQNLRIEDNGKKLVNYGTVLAEYIEGNLFINSTKYSVTTSKIQTWIRAESYQYTEITGVPMGTYSLRDYLPKCECEGVQDSRFFQEHGTCEYCFYIG